MFKKINQTILVMRIDSKWTLSQFWGVWDGSRHNNLPWGGNPTLSNHLERTEWMWITLLFTDRQSWCHLPSYHFGLFSGQHSCSLGI